MLFTETIANWADWGRVYQSIPAFAKLAEEILRREGFPAAPLAPLTPGTNAVFLAGDVVVKIYAPKETGMDQSKDKETEVFAARFAKSRRLSAAPILAEGVIRDKYDFSYLLMRYIHAPSLDDLLPEADEKRQFALGKALRQATDRLNVPCPAFCGADALCLPEESRWESFPASFQNERCAFVETHPYGEPVFVHGDLCTDNVLVGNELVLIDFADALLAPKCYEHALVLFEYRAYPAFLRGFFDGEDAEKVYGDVLAGILIHAFGGDLVKDAFGDPAGIPSLDALYGKICGIRF